MERGIRGWWKEGLPFSAKDILDDKSKPPLAMFEASQGEVLILFSEIVYQLGRQIYITQGILSKKQVLPKVIPYFENELGMQVYGCEVEST